MRRSRQTITQLPSEVNTASAKQTAEKKYREEVLPDDGASVKL